MLLRIESSDKTGVFLDIREGRKQISEWRRRDTRLTTFFLRCLTQHGWLDFTRCIRAITHERDIHFAGEVPYFSIGIPISAQDYLTSTVVRVKRVFIDALQQHASSHIDQRRNRCNRSRFPVIYSRRLVRNRSTKVDPSAGRMHRWQWWERYILHFHFRITSCTRSRSFSLLHFFFFFLSSEFR